MVVAPTRPPATGHHESVLWKSTQHTAELVAYHGVTPVSKQPCERQRHGCCPAQWVWDTVYDECYKGGQPDLSLLLLARELYLRDAAPAPPISWRAPLTRSNTSTMHSACEAWAGRNEALEAAVQHDKTLENEKFALRLTAWPSEPPFINLGGGFRPQFPTTSHDFSVLLLRGGTAHKSISSYLTTLWVADFSNTSSLGRHWPEIRSFNELTNLTGFTFISDTRSAIESCLKCHPRKGLFRNYGTSDTTQGRGFWLLLYSTALAWDEPSKVQDLPCHWSLANSPGCKAMTLYWLLIFQYLEARTFLESVSTFSAQELLSFGNYVASCMTDLQFPEVRSRRNWAMQSRRSWRQMLTPTMNWADIVCAGANSVYEARPTYRILGRKCGGYFGRRRVGDFQFFFD